ncbi:uncharacterized protein ASPGLDRAFT_138897 [Aspergillus glaucus CBS 516.65]|uniref:Rhodopsin domain-containing protein n=1 Tax=Aspergillus glaucus CBS 516.65 TaxID=1160497 RepID=A0A1L9V3C7_ASPGL|nr:hypothetical protein ASPGLDRAFT_138897 [Aspergillus glaucus CBS 516.65]OJJ78444.1 hypothetical protein ASPGLDRAFT_138897 [Aspergillus glaucus CBS 516.65]
MSPGDASVEGFILMSLGLVFIIIRVVVRWTSVGPANFQLDDYLMPLAGIIFVLETVAAHLVLAKFNGLTNSYMTPEQRAAVVPYSEEYNSRVWGSKIQVMGWSFYAMILWLVKFSVAIFYSRLTTGLQHLPTRVRIAYVLLGVTYLAAGLSIVLGCQPIHKYWQINPDPGNICQPTKSLLYVLVVVILNVITDLYLLSIPLPLLWTVNIGIRRKITLMGLFSGAAFVIMASIIRAVVILTAGPDGAISGSRWACRETFVSIIVSNLPIIQPIIRRACNKMGLSGVFFSNSGRPTNSNTYPLSSRGLQTTNKDKKKNNSPPYIPETTAWGSDEHILAVESGHGQSKDITVVSETVVQSDPWNDPGPATTPPDHWGSPLRHR